MSLTVKRNRELVAYLITMELLERQPIKRGELLGYVPDMF
jgi:hypothetical protein